MQSKLESSTTPKFMFEDSKIMDENVSVESSSPEELLEVWMTAIYRIFVMEYYFIINSEAYICIFLTASVTIFGNWLPRSSCSTYQV